MPAKKKKKFEAGKEVRAIARERVGTVKPSRVIPPKKKPKYQESDPLQEQEL